MKELEDLAKEDAMSEPVSLLMAEFLAWVSSRRRTYEEAMEAWQTSCPRHPVWEDALTQGFIRVASDGQLHQADVTLTPRGRAILEGSSARRGNGRLSAS
jgi:hypothetical protein